MNAIALGPVLISLPRLYALICALLLLAGARYFSDLSPTARKRWFSGAIIAWVVAARLGHVALHADSYATEPLAALKLWQPGYHGTIGLIGALGYSAVTLRHRLAALMRVAVLLFATFGLWLGLTVFSPLGGSDAQRTLPDITLDDLDGNPVALASLAAGDDTPVIVNLWATWCPPCRREMPLLEEFGQRGDVRVVIVNQGEDLLPVVRYLDSQGLNFDTALRDPQQRLMTAFETPGLPTTLLLDARGQVQQRHAGELTRATLNRWLAH
ncbi:MAG: TlpA family protein disulfide reductase [Halomonas sp.]|nr:TlpA disulfide reductase family protein [Halomonas sp.]MDN6296870.1 TlpA family protein disulfide reductase [Halomonas sp.]MDN6314412.1 TlpA family protein disulfide reductase [Halomonas sp.]MDN6335628.1 TlpA family protein disulfide reductase [Halomonas sp.]